MKKARQKQTRSRLTTTLLLVAALLFPWRPVSVKGYPAPVLAASARKVAPYLAARIKKTAGTLAGSQNCRVMIQPGTSASLKYIASKVSSLGGAVCQTYRNLRLVTADLPLSRVTDLEADTAITWISPDRRIQASGFVETTTGTAQARDFTGGMTLTGAGIGVAIIDSGIYTSHSAFTGPDREKTVVFARDFTGAGLTSDDIYG
ncbi:MAG: hypothetical protein ACKV2V_29810, partial [Blastocatellia bacterium]